MMNWLFTAALCLVAVHGACAWAQGDDEAVVVGEAVVPDRSDATRTARMPSVLADALLRLSPDAEAAGAIDTAAALAADEQLLQRFEYEQVVRPTASGIPSIRLMLRGWFRVAPAQALLVRSGAPVWRGGRVAPMFWLVEDTADGRRLLDGEADERARAFAEALVARGVRPAWSVNDLQDWRMAEQLDREHAPELLQGAAARAVSDLAVLAWIRAGEEGTGVEWFIHGNDLATPFASAGADVAEALVAGVPRLLAVLAEHAAVQPAALTGTVGTLDRGPGEYVVWIENLARAGAYSAATALLQAQPAVTSMVPEQASDDRIRVRIGISTPLASLLSLLAADGRLLLSSDPPGDADFTLRWQD